MPVLSVCVQLYPYVVRLAAERALQLGEALLGARGVSATERGSAAPAVDNQRSDLEGCRPFRSPSSAENFRARALRRPKANASQRWRQPHMPRRFGPAPCSLCATPSAGDAMLVPTPRHPITAVAPLVSGPWVRARRRRPVVRLAVGVAPRMHDAACDSSDFLSPKCFGPILAERTSSASAVPPTVFVLCRTSRSSFN